MWSTLESARLSTLHGTAIRHGPGPRKSGQLPAPRIQQVDVVLHGITTWVNLPVGRELARSHAPAPRTSAAATSSRAVLFVACLL